MSLRARLALATAVATLAVGCLASVGLYLSTVGTVRQALQSSLRASAGRVAGQVAGRVVTLGSPQHPLRSHDQQFVQVFDTGGALLYTTSGAGPRRAVKLATLAAATGSLSFFRIRHAADGSNYLASVQAIELGRERRLVVVGASLDQLDDSANHLRVLLGLGVPLFGLLAYLAALVLSDRALRPVERLRGQAEALRVAQAPERLQVPSTRDELSKLARTLNVFLDDVGSQIERQRVFLASASHELRGPLARLSADLELALSPRTDPTRTRRLVEMAAHTVADLSRLCDGLLAIASAQSSSLELEPRPTLLGPFLLSVLEGFRGPAGERQVDLVVDVVDEGLTVLVDARHFTRVVENVVDNALRYAGPGSAVVISSRRAGSMAEVTVADEGPGFPSLLLERALEPFARAHDESSTGSATSRERHNAGLGLSIAALIVELHAGTIEVGNRAEGGAFVRVRVPSVDSPRAVASTPADTEVRR